MPPQAHGANPEDGTEARFRGSPLDRRERGEKTAPFGHQEPIGRDTKGGVMVKTAPASSFIMPQSEFLLQLLVAVLDDPALLSYAHQMGTVRRSRQSG